MLRLDLGFDNLPEKTWAEIVSFGNSHSILWTSGLSGSDEMHYSLVRVPFEQCRRSQEG
jgi:hypothetical protein